MHVTVTFVYFYLNESIKFPTSYLDGCNCIVINVSVAEYKRRSVFVALELAFYYLQKG